MDGNIFNSNIKEYYAPPPISSSKNNNKNVKNFIQNNNNFDLIINNKFSHNSNEFDIINFNDKLDFDISPQKKNNNQMGNNSLDNNINLDSIEEIKINKNDSLKFEEMTDRVEDKKRGKVIDRIVKGRAKLNDNNKNRNDLNGSNIMEKDKFYEKVLGNSRRSEEFNDNNDIINNKIDNC